MGLVTTGGPGGPCAVPFEISRRGPMIPMCDDQENRARACPGYAPGRTAGQGLSQWSDRGAVAGHRPYPSPEVPGRRSRPRRWSTPSRSAPPIPCLKPPAAGITRKS